MGMNGLLVGWYRTFVIVVPPAFSTNSESTTACPHIFGRKS
jgi:hypothetical protein